MYASRRMDPARERALCIFPLLSCLTTPFPPHPLRRQGLASLFVTGATPARRHTDNKMAIFSYFPGAATNLDLSRSSSSLPTPDDDTRGTIEIRRRSIIANDVPVSCHLWWRKGNSVRKIDWTRGLFVPGDRVRIGFRRHIFYCDSIYRHPPT